MKKINIALCATLVLGIAAALYACRPAAYSAELDACVSSSSTEAQSQECRCEVSKKYGRACDPITDASIADAGKE